MSVEQWSILNLASVTFYQSDKRTERSKKSKESERMVSNYSNGQKESNTILDETWIPGQSWQINQTICTTGDHQLRSVVEFRLTLDWKICQEEISEQKYHLFMKMHDWNFFWSLIDGQWIRAINSSLCSNDFRIKSEKRPCIETLKIPHAARIEFFFASLFRVLKNDIFHRYFKWCLSASCGVLSQV